MPEFIPHKFRSILNSYKWIDSWFWGKHSINPYSGCSFGCLYCDARSNKYHLPQDFEEKILVKEGAGKALRSKLLRSRSLRPDVVIFSGVTDPYQPAERQFRLTRECLQVLRDIRWPVHVITKARSVVDDIPLFREISKNNWVSVSFSLPVFDPETARWLEPYAPEPKLRLQALRQIRAEAPGVQTGVLMTPVVPGFGDKPEELERTVAEAAAAGAQYLLFGGGMTLRDTQAEYFLGRMARDFPGQLKLYEAIFSFQYEKAKAYSGAYIPDKTWTLELEQRLFELCQKYHLPMRIPRFIPTDFRKLNYRIAEKWLNEAWEKRIRRQDSKELHWAGMKLQNLETSARTLLAEQRTHELDFLSPELMSRLQEELRILLGESNP